jgi:hypothetical protein
MVQWWVLVHRGGAKVPLDTLEAPYDERTQNLLDVTHLENPGLHGWTMTINVLEL